MIFPNILEKGHSFTAGAENCFCSHGNSFKFDSESLDLSISARVFSTWRNKRTFTNCRGKLHVWRS